MLYRAKTFYALSGLKRSSIRYYEENGLLRPDHVDDNGYAYYGQKELIDTMLIKNSRGMDVQIRQIKELFNSPINEQIELLEVKQEEYAHEIALLQQKKGALSRYETLLKECANTSGTKFDDRGQVFYYLPFPNNEPDENVQEELAHCINAFPLVHIGAHGSLAQMAIDDVLALTPGYEYRADNGFKPLKKELYQKLEAKPCLIKRIKVLDPLHIPSSQVTPIIKEMKTKGYEIRDQIYGCISAREKVDGEYWYYLSLRVVAL